MTTTERLTPDWISAYMEYTKDTEPPKSYHTWTAIHCVAATLQRKVWLTFGSDRIYPNMYIVLVGPSGARKGTAMKRGKDLLEAVGIPMTGDKPTPEQLIRKLADSTSNFKVGSQVMYQSALAAFSPELTVFLGQSDIKFLGFLTDWYDCAGKWEYETKHGTKHDDRNKDEINNLCLNLFAGTAPEWIPTMIPLEAVGGGFTSRILFIVERGKGKTVPKELFLQEHKDLRDMLIRDLQRIHAMTGEFRFGEDAERAYIDWYSLQDRMISKGTPPLRDPKFAGYCERRQTHLRKLCMVMSASRGGSHMISLEDFKRALAVLELAERNMPSVFGGLGRNKTAAIAHAIYEYIKRHSPVTRSELLERFYQDVDWTTLEQIEQTLVHMKTVQVVYDEKLTEKTYTATSPSGNRSQTGKPSSQTPG